ncbi:MAG: alpha-(1-_3)-arabinofuranosyltransferase family protein, partial [Acidimicrobiales bacterium]
MVNLRRPGWVGLARAGELAALAVIAYLPFLLSSPGRVSADSKQALYVDPGRFLEGAAFMWDPSSGAGTVPHQHIGYLWPMGPWFWAFEQLGVPDWVAQRLWLGTLTFLAALGARWLLRQLGAGPLVAFAGALVYALSPYQLAFTARASVLLLPWVGLPWLLELTRRALRWGGWRHPALIALTVATVAGVNATSLALVAIGPILVVVHHALGGLPEAARSAATAVRIGALSLLASAWWLAGLWVQGAHGMPVLQLTENLAEVARWSMPNDVLRGLGNWFFAGEDRLGYSIDQAEPYLDNPWVVAVSLVIPALALAAAVLTTGARRVFAVACMVVATVVAVGAWPYGDPSWFGRGVRWFGEETSVGLAFRNSHRIVPVLLIGVVVVLATWIQSMPRSEHRRLGASLLAVAALATMAPIGVHGYLSEHLDRPESLPQEWVAAAEHLDARGTLSTGNPSRVLEVPGSPFAAHRWGNTVEPVLPALIDRPHLAREVLPYGSAATANLLDALDRRMQEGIVEPESLAPVARLFAAGDVVIRSDLQFERFQAPEPYHLWSALTQPAAPGAAEVATFGAVAVNEPERRLAPVDPRHLNFAALRGTRPPLVGGPVPPITSLEMSDAPGVLRVHDSHGPIVLAGDGDGVVDAAAAGLVDGRSLLLYSAGLDDAALDDALSRDARLVLTDSNRRRIQTWFYAIRDTRGATERAGETLIEPTGYDVRLDPFAGSSDDARTVVEHLGGQVSASLSGGAARPEDRAFAAFDGDLATAWRIGGADPRGHRVSVELDEAIAPDQLVLVQPQDGPRDRVVESVRIHFDGAPPVDVELDATSSSPTGQPIALDLQDPVRRFEIEITGVSDPGFEPELANAVGFAEVQIPGVSLAETVVLPRELFDRAGEDVGDHLLDVVLTRLRYDPYARGRTDAERWLDRTFELPGSRSFSLGGTVRANPGAPDAVLDELLDTSPAGTVEATSRLQGDIDARASSAFDGDQDTAWTAAFGPQAGQSIRARYDEPVSMGSVAVEVANDELHSMPTELALRVDGEIVGTHRLERSPDPGPPGSLHRIELEIDPVTGQEFELEIVDVERRSSPPGDPAPMATLPVAVSEMEVGNPNPVIDDVGRLDTGCRDDLLDLDGEPLAVRVHGPSDQIRDGLEVELCDGAVELGPGRHRLVAAPGHVSGLDLDRLVLSASAEGGFTAAGHGRDGPAPVDLVEVRAGRTSWSATVRSDGTPMWVVLGQSINDGWTATATDVETGARLPVGDRTLVNGYANGWLVEPETAGTIAVELRWEPQRIVWWALAVSVFAIGICLGLVLGTRASPVAMGAGDIHTPITLPGDGRRPGAVALTLGAAATGAAMF